MNGTRRTGALAASRMAHAQFVERRETNGAMLLAQPIAQQTLHSSHSASFKTKKV